MTVREQVEPTIKRLRVAGLFAEGMTLPKEECMMLAKGLTLMADYIDADMALEAKEQMRRQIGWELVKCAAVVLLFVVGAVWFNG